MRLREQIYSEDRHIIATRSMRLFFFSFCAALFLFFSGSVAASAPINTTPSILMQSSVLIADAVSLFYLRFLVMEVFPVDWSIQISSLLFNLSHVLLPSIDPKPTG